MMTKLIWLPVAVLTALTLLFAGCAGVGARVQEENGYTDISAGELAEMLEDKDFVLVNVHAPYQGEIPQTDLFIPFNEIAEHTDRLPGKDQPVVVYCRSGSMSTTAADTLVSLGYTDVFEVDGGMRAWRASGYELLGQ